YTADLIPTAAHIPLSYVCGYDIFPLLTIQETEAFLREAEENNMTLFFEHDMQVECCSLHKTEKGVALHESFSLEKFIFSE
ncbi:MAG: MBL fold metallo-hydrolase, partial [Bacteroidota bacterium]